MRSVIESNTNPTYDKAQALRLYVEQSEMDTLLGEDMERYRVALVKTGGTVDNIEAIQRFHEAFEGPVDVAYAAAVVGLETEVFLNKIKENAGLQNIGLLVLESGSMKRDAWTSSFRDIVFALDFPERFTPSDSYNTAETDTGQGCSDSRPEPPCCDRRGTWQKPQRLDYRGRDGKVDTP